MYREDILAHAYELVKSHQGAPGVDGQSFRGIETQGLEEWLKGLKEDPHWRRQPLSRVLEAVYSFQTSHEVIH